jgi:hypothetical protein
VQLPGVSLSPAWRGLAIDLAIFGAIGLLMGTLGPYGTSVAPTGLRYGYWFVAIVGGGAIGLAFERLFVARIASRWIRVPAVALAMTPPVTVFVYGLNVVMLGGGAAFWPAFLGLSWQVFAIALAVMAVRALVWRDPVIETRTLIEPPLPEADAAFRRRLSAKRRTARLIAVEAHDHYLRVHTDDGSELVALRFADALDELSRAHGYRTHRSWWVAADAIEDARWQRGTGVVRLAGGLEAPVSRTCRPTLKAAGWL